MIRKISYRVAFKLLQFNAVCIGNIFKIDPNAYYEYDDEYDDETCGYDECEYHITGMDSERIKIINKLFPDTFEWIYSPLLDCYILSKIYSNQSWDLDVAYVDTDEASKWWFRDYIDKIADEFEATGQNANTVILTPIEIKIY